jgi:nicotinate-nucleotide pyrophosphorylase (carboxylating)
LAAFRELDPGLRFEPVVEDGSLLQAGQVVAEIEGDARAILGAERVALNFLGRLSGVATATAALASRIRHTEVKLTSTRKTTPGQRAFEKYAVRCGGGSNHRFGLYDAVLIKDNHIALAGGVGEAIVRARAFVGHLVKIEVEVDTLAQLAEALAASPDAVLLDNMPPPDLRDAVVMAGARLITEASGGVTEETIAEIAETGVDYISSGWITHSAPALDIGLDFDPRQI